MTKCARELDGLSLILLALSSLSPWQDAKTYFKLIVLATSEKRLAQAGLYATVCSNREWVTTTCNPVLDHGESCGLARAAENDGHSQRTRNAHQLSSTRSKQFLPTTYVRRFLCLEDDFLAWARNIDYDYMNCIAAN